MPIPKFIRDATGRLITDDEQVDKTTTASDSVREAALGQLKDKLLNTVAPPKQEDPIFKVKRLMKAGVPNPLQTALAQKGM